MNRKRKDVIKSEELFVGIDIHKRTWHVTIRTDEVELFSGSIPGIWEVLRRLLDRYKAQRIYAVYEAGYFGFWLHDHLTEYGVDCLVTPPSLVPQEYGNRVKTDRRDSQKLARLLSKGMLKRIWVPSAEERFHRQVIRRRRQLVRDRVRIQNRIKAELHFYGVDLSAPQGKWTQIYFDNLRRIKFKNSWMQKSFSCLLDQYEFLCGQINKQTRLLKELSQLPRYRDRVEILRTIPGIGMINAMEILLELQDLSRFRRAEQLAVRTALVESCWWLISKDTGMQRRYKKIKARAGAKRAIVAIARRLLLRIRRMLIDAQPYKFEPIT